MRRKRKKIYGRGSKPFGGPALLRPPDPKSVQRFLQLVTSGMSVGVVSRTAGMPTVKVWLRWCRENTEIGAAYEAAKEARLVLLQQQILELAESGGDPERVAEQIDVRKKLYGALCKGRRRELREMAESEEV